MHKNEKDLNRYRTPINFIIIPKKVRAKWPQLWLKLKKGMLK